MNTKKITVILIAIAFGLVVLFSCVGLLSIKKVEVKYAVSENRSDTDQTQKALDTFLGGNLLFLDVNEVRTAIANQAYMEILSIDKNFPNVLSVSIRERKETYRLIDGEKTYILNEQGIVLNDTGELTQGRKVIDLSFIAFRNAPNSTLKITVESAVVGEKIVTSNDAVVYETLKVADKVGLSDCISKIYIEDCTGNEYDVSFETHTGAKIYVVDAMADGERKCLTAFNVYDTLASDYQKRFGLIESSYVEDKLKVQHTFDDIDAEERNDVLLFSEDI